MSYRYMRVIVFFDLPTQTPQDLKNYRSFRRYLIKSVFVMIQESVYTKITKNMASAGAIDKKLRDHVPTKGLIQLLTITEKQFSRMEYLIGDEKSIYITDDRRLIIL